ncbi:MAG: protein kinase [Planctomycetota bacterium]
MLDDASHDRALAQRLLASGRLPAEQLRAFEALGGPRPALARWLVEAGLLRATEVEELLASALAESWSEGGRIGDYRLERRLGAGGMGEVWLAHDLRSGHARAIKTLLPSASATTDARFAREVDALTRVDGHPNVVRVHAAGHAQGRPYVVLDYAPGGDLAQRLEQGPLGPSEARRILVELAAGLGHVHAHGFLHRDLKPQNVLFAEDGRALLTDFGVVRGEDHDALTRSGQLVGTLSYMAPEQALGQPADVRADIYGLGAILYHMLTGIPPEAAVFRGMQSPADTNPSAPPELVRVCLKATARDPRRRYPSARAVAHALEHPDALSGSWTLRLALAAALIGVCGVSAALWLRGRRGPAATPPRQATTPDRAPPASAPPDTPSAPDVLQAVLDALPRPDPRHEDGTGTVMGVIAGISGLRSVGDSLRKDDPRQAAAYYLAAIRDGDVDCWARLARQIGFSDLGLEDRPAAYLACLERGVAEGSTHCALQLAEVRWSGDGSLLPLDLKQARADYRRALELAARIEAFDPPRADQVRRDVHFGLIAFARARRDHPDAPSALEALESAARYEHLGPSVEELRVIRAAAPSLFSRARAELRARVADARVEDPAHEFSPAQVLQVEVYPEAHRPLRWGLLFKDARRYREAAACFCEVGDVEGRAWYELGGMLQDAPGTFGIDPERLEGPTLACLWGAAEAEHPDPSALNALAKLYTSGRPGWPLEPDPLRATALGRRGLDLATDGDLRADLELTLAELALLHGGRQGCPTLEEGRAFLASAAAADRLGHRPRIERVRASYARLDPK